MMDDSTSFNAIPKEIVNNTELSFLLKLENSTFPTNLKHKNTVIKYTKLPNFTFDSKASWSHHNYSLHPRLRRIVTLEDRDLETSRSLKQDLEPPTKMSSNCPKRKIITITGENELNPYPKLSKDGKKSAKTKTSTRSIGTDYKCEKSHSQRTISRISSPSKYAKDSRQHITKPKSNENHKQVSPNFIIAPENDKVRIIKERDKAQNNKAPKTSLIKNLTVSVESDKDAPATKLRFYADSKSSISSNKATNKLQVKKFQSQQNKLKSVNDYMCKNKPLNENHQKHVISKNGMLHSTIKEKHTKFMDCGTEVDKTLTSRDISAETVPLSKRVDQITEIERDFGAFCMKMNDNFVQTDTVKKDFDSLDIPNVTLTKESKKLTRKELHNLYSTSLPDLKTPTIDIISVKGDRKTSEPHFHKSSSYIIGRATVTYTTEQKIDFHVVGKNEEVHTTLSPSPLAYPMNVVSVYKKEIKNSRSSNMSNIEKSKKKDKSYFDCLQSNDLNSVNYRHAADGSKLMKPSDIISTIRVNNSLLQSGYICEQFQKELNFIDSFFESLQYLERLSEKCFIDANPDSWIYNKRFEVNESEYISDITKIGNGPNVDDTETMATKSLCQLNLLIHNEQRRARDFLFVLKMQEDVLKDYIKSQMLWLEKKKKQDNIDISALKKKQRGALLKLQHECGEMQRMRKALLTLSEKRKVALMKTKKNIEMKLKNNVDVEQIILGKKKLKRNTVSDRCLAPLKCFDLSSSGCEEGTTSRAKSESACCSALAVDPTLPSLKSITSAEKSIQTGESISAVDLHSQLTSTAAEHCVVVDGGYLNILFHNLSLPQIFSNGKQYEVNEEALRNIVNSSNCQNNISNDSDVIEKFMDQIKNHDTDASSTPSTAHSLVEEFDQYYKSLGEEDKSLANSPECENREICELKDSVVQTESNNDTCEHNNVSMISMDSDESLLKRLSNVYGIDRSCVCEPSVVSVENQASSKEITGARVSGPLPVPAGEAAPIEAQLPDMRVWIPSKTSDNTIETANNQEFCSNNSSISPYTSPVLYEAEELRRQQLAIEREIKALEQQQCQLLVVREIPDKPPPPYTPPSESRGPKLPRMFLADNVTEQKIQKHFIEIANNIFDINDPFDAFVKEFCQENIERQRSETSDKPWDACNLLPQKPQPDANQIVKKTYTDLKEVLSGVTPACVSGVGSRRSDHIDDILFAEWRRCEPEWTSLHTDEAIVKNQLFESIFQKILTDTMDEYKRIVFIDRKNVKK